MNPMGSPSKSSEFGVYGIVGGVIVALLVPVLLAVVLNGSKKGKKRGVPIKLGGEEGYTMRHARAPDLVEVPWEGATTMPALFEQSCKKYSSDRLLGTREFIDKEFVTASDGRKFEKLHLGEYKWQTYGEVFERVCNFASGLVNVGHNVDDRVAIFSDTRAEWFIAFQVRSSDNGCSLFCGFCLNFFDEMGFGAAKFSGMFQAEHNRCYYLCFFRRRGFDILTQ